MARGESQTLLIWTIIFLIFSLIMIIVTVVMRQKYNDASTQLADATSKNQQLTNEVGSLKKDGATLREMIGYATADMPVSEIETAFADHTKLYAPTLSQQGTSYLTALKTLFDSYKDQVNKNESLSVEKDKLIAEVNFNNTKKEELRRDLQVLVDEARTDLKSAQQSHETQLTNLMATNKKLEEDKNTTERDAREAIAKANELRDTANARSDKVLLINTNLTKMVADMDSPVLTYSDAEVLWVSADSSMVRINLGSKHGLRPRMPFSVYSSDVKEISVDSGKGKIEITKIIDANTAEARVTESILVNPILPGDIIYTPIWKPGQHIHVALSNGIDLDGDGIPDPHKAIMLIKMCGGEVDAYIDDLTGDMILENNKMVRETFLVGQIGSETRYLILGDSPDPDSSVTLFNARRELENSAKENGLTIITLKDMLTLMGQRQQSQTVGFGPRNRATNNYEMEPDVVNQRMPGRVFNKYEDPDAKPATNDKTPVSPLFNQRKVTLPSGTVSPLFQPKTAPSKDVASN